ncbi:MAG: FliG C-terminal domain-containing protein [Spirochaetales bacterium]|nr:FliG C-terminal domain-containing protein [Spirochaetales bacterium]
MAETNYLPKYKNRTGNPRVVFMDFRRPDKFSKEQIRTMAMIHENYARLATVKLSAMFQQKVEIHLSSVDQCTYSEFTSLYPQEEPASFAILGNKKIKSSALLTLSNRLSYLMQVRSYGQQIPDNGNFKGFSGLSIKLMKHIVSKMLIPLNKSWEGIGHFPFYVKNMEHNILFAQILPPTEMVILLTWEVTMFGESHKMELCIPYLFMEPIMSRLSPIHYFGLREREMQNLRKPEFNKVKIPGRIECDCKEISLDELLNMKKGDIISVEGLDEGKALLSWGDRRIEKLKVLKDFKEFSIVKEEVQDTDLLKLLSGNNENSSEHKLDLLTSKLDELSQNLDRRIAELNQGQDLLNDQILLNETSSLPDAADFDFINQGDLEFICDLFNTEPFQLNALLLSLLPSPLAAGYLENFNSEEQAELCERISHTDLVEPGIPILISEYLNERIRNFGNQKNFLSSGILKTAEILQHSRRSIEASVINQLESRHPETAQQLKENMFVMEDLVILTEESLNMVAQKADPRDLALGLKPLNEEIKERILAKLSKETIQNIKPILDSGRPYRLGMMEEAQHNVISLVREMEKAGLIFLDEEEFRDGNGSSSPFPI